MGKDCKRTSLILQGAEETGMTIDCLAYLLDGLSLQACRKVIGNVSSMPKNMKSSDNPYVWRSARAPSNDSL